MFSNRAYVFCICQTAPALSLLSFSQDQPVRLSRLQEDYYSSVMPDLSPKFSAFMTECHDNVGKHTPIVFHCFSWFLTFRVTPFLQINPDKLPFFRLFTSSPQPLGGSCRFCLEPDRLTRPIFIGIGLGGMRYVAGSCPFFPPHGPAVIRAVPCDFPNIVFRNHRHRVPRLGISMRGILSPLEEEDSFVPSRPPARPCLW